MNEGIAKALRRQARAQGLGVTAPGRGTVIPGKETKALWQSLSHKQRSEWRKQLPETRAQKRAAERHGRLNTLNRQQHAELGRAFRRGRLRFRTGKVLVFYPRSVQYLESI